MVVEACAQSSRLSGSRNAFFERNVAKEGSEVAATAAAGVGPDGGDASGEVQGHIESAGPSGEEPSSSSSAMSRAMTFGGFASGAPWKKMGRTFAGDGGCFLFSFDKADEGSSKYAGDQPPFEEDGIPGGGGSVGDGAGLRVYPWSQKTRCFMTSGDGVGLGMGSGGDGGSFGFLLSEDLRSGSTGYCETFQNPPLVPVADSGVGGSAGVAEEMGTVFDVISVELWGFRAAKAPQGLLTRIAL